MSEYKFVCACREDCRSACDGLEFYREVEGKKYCVLHCPIQNKVPEFTAALQRTFSNDFRGIYFPTEFGLPTFKLGFADFGFATFSAPVDFRFTEFTAGVNFSEATFCDTADFGLAEFKGTVNFTETKFVKAAIFSSAKFHRHPNCASATSCDCFNEAEFETENEDENDNKDGSEIEVDFKGATFEGRAAFSDAKFGADTFFARVLFNDDTDFMGVVFYRNAYFAEVTLKANAEFSFGVFQGIADFGSAKLESYFRFQKATFAETSWLSLDSAEIAKPERVIFHTVSLRPHWFVSVDCRKFELTSVKWEGFSQESFTWSQRMKQKLERLCNRWPEYLRFCGGSAALHDELQSLDQESKPRRLLSITCRQLATNYEENNRYNEAATFRYASMDVERLEKWRGWNIFTLHWWYWLVSGYGEHIPRAMICLLGLLLGFSFLFTKVGFEAKATAEIAPIVQEMMLTPPPPKELPLPSLRDGLTYAMSAALFQRPEPKAYTFWAKTCVSLEMILVPLQAALLALAIRRRFMR